MWTDKRRGDKLVQTDERRKEVEMLAKACIGLHFPRAAVSLRLSLPTMTLTMEPAHRHIRQRLLFFLQV